MSECVTFEIDIVQGKQRPRVTKFGVYTPRETVDAEKRVRKAFLDAVNGGEMLESPWFPDGELSLHLFVYRPLPKSRSKRLEHEPDTFKPDTDNIAKLVMDALNGVAYTDDKQITDLHVIKFHRSRLISEPRTEIELKKLR